MNTKERILDEALTLFAEKGYDGTGVDQIAQRVGIKAPSLYKHFKGKEDILNALIDAAETRYEEFFGSERRIGELPADRDSFVRTAMDKVLFTMHDPMIRKIRRFLVQEQFRSERLAAITTKHQLDGIQRMYTKIIAAMMDEGLFRQDDPAMMSIELTAPIVLWLSKVDRQPQSEAETVESMRRHIRHFWDVYAAPVEA